MLLLLLLNHFSCVSLCAILETAAHQAPPSLGFSRQELGSGLPFPSPMHESENEVAQSCLTPSDPMDCSLPGSSIHGICQARVLEWVAIAFSKIYVTYFENQCFTYRSDENHIPKQLCNSRRKMRTAIPARHDIPVSIQSRAVTAIACSGPTHR